MTENSVPRVIVFDLDGTLWSPEMYQLWGGGGAPFKLHPTDTAAAVDKAGTVVHMLGDTQMLLQELFTGERWSKTVLGISSTCDEPSWAMELLRLFSFSDSSGKKVPMLSLFGNFVEIYSENKAKHHRTILRKVQQQVDNDISLDDMIFFDNQTNNVRNVSSIGVTSVYCPDGMTMEIFEKGIEQWRREHKKSTL